MLKDLKRLLAKCHWNSKLNLEFYKGAKPKYLIQRVQEILHKNPKEINSEDVVNCIRFLNIALLKIEKESNGPVQHSEDTIVRT